MRVAVGADHGAVELRKELVTFLQERGHEVLDHGAFAKESVDYPDYAHLVANDILSGRAEAGILVCTTGIGMSIAANKVRGIRAALVSNDDEARYCRLHNKANIICFGSKHHTVYDARHYTEIFLNTDFEGGRHERRINKLENVPNLC